MSAVSGATQTPKTRAIAAKKNTKFPVCFISSGLSSFTTIGHGDLCFPKVSSLLYFFLFPTFRCFGIVVEAKRDKIHNKTYLVLALKVVAVLTFGSLFTIDYINETNLETQRLHLN